MRLARKRDIGFLAYLALILGLRLFPPSFRLRQAYRVARVFSRIWLLLSPGEGEQAAHNLGLMFNGRKPPRGVSQTVRDHFTLHAWVFVLNDLIPHLSRDELQALADVRGLEHLDQALTQAKGAVLLTAHYGAHGYIVLAILQAYGYPVTAIFGHEVQPDDSWFYRNAIYPIRSHPRASLPVVDRGMMPNPALLQTLRRNGVLMVQCDNHLTEEQVAEEHHILTVPFLWGTAPLRSGPIRLPKVFGSPALPLFTHWDGTRLAIEIQEPLALSPGSSREDIVSDVHAYTRLLEERILAAPEQWGFTRHSNIPHWIRPMPPELEREGHA